MQLEGKSAIITGGSRGIGKAVAKAFFDQGCSLTLSARDRNALMQACRDITGHAGQITRVEICPTDVSREELVREIAQFALNRFGSIDILVNCAAI